MLARSTSVTVEADEPPSASAATIAASAAAHEPLLTDGVAAEPLFALLSFTATMKPAVPPSAQYISANPCRAFSAL